MSKAFFIYGASGHAKVVIESLASRGIDIAGLYDDDVKKHRQFIVGHSVIGDRACLLENIKSLGSACYVIIAIGNNRIRQCIYTDLKKLGVRFGLAQHASASLSLQSMVGEGSVVFNQVIVQAGSQIGRNVILNTGAIIDHDCKIADHVHIAPGAVLCGDVSVGEGSMVGAGATVIQGVSIGSNVMVAAGAVVTKNIGDNVLVAGCPAKVIKNC
jgi:sugar O-acyltransferase (sialic acid O-acetyltransferase NeuD family)